MEYAEKFSVTSQKLVFRLGLRPAPLTPDLASQTMPAGAVDHAGFHQRPDGQIGGGRIAAGIGDQARAGDAPAAEFRQSVDGLGEQFRLRVGFLVPGGVVLGSAEAEGAAQIDDAGAGVEHDGRQFHGDFGGSGQENNGKLRLVTASPVQGMRVGGAARRMAAVAGSSR